MNTNEPKDGATARPWMADDRHIHPVNGLTYTRGVEPETDVIVLVDTDQHRNGLLNDTDKANLALIVAAVNQHDALRRVAEAAQWVPCKHHALSEALAALDKLKEWK